ncbi:MAG: putative glycoside hydrolase [Patescibacteria group bacterium]
MDFLEKIIVSLCILMVVPFTAGFYFVISQSFNVEPEFITAMFRKSSTTETVLKKVSPVKTANNENLPDVINNVSNEENNLSNPSDLIIPPKKLETPPSIINAVYVTGWSAGNKSYLNYLTNLFQTTEINAVVIDIKDYSGLISYNSGAEEVKKYNLYANAIPDINALVKFFHDQNIYVIGRISVFEDPAYSKARPDLAIYDKTKTIDPANNPVLWLDNHNLSWLDPASKEVWDYNISLAKDAFLRGFDEINFDYIRFPSDGKLENMGFPHWDGKTLKHFALNNFFQYLRASLPDEKISVDLFGQTTTSKDDMGVGQLLEDSFNYFDYVSPMVYPSHYVSGFIGFSNPADHPYEVIKYSMDSALKRLVEYNNLQKTSAKFRPWVQDFNMGAHYDAEKVKLEIKALKDALGENYNGFMLWNPSNLYTKEAVVKIQE